MTARAAPQRHWRSCGLDKLPSGEQALDEPFSAFPSWYLRIVCARCGKERMINEVHMERRDLPLFDILDLARHDGCGGRAGKAELLTGIEGASSRPVRKIVLREGWRKAGTPPGFAAAAREFWEHRGGCVEMTVAWFLRRIVTTAS